mgnify:CR=1 FL=1
MPLTGRLTALQVKQAHKSLAVQHHPDKGGDPEKFKEISHTGSDDILSLVRKFLLAGLGVLNGGLIPEPRLDLLLEGCRLALLQHQGGALS